ncbi:MAG: rhodanese-like domain-containing protein [Pedobacter sp.]|nr:MAG: rhodanese-like domain-containing protein [Pedobacter sp.]
MVKTMVVLFGVLLTCYLGYRIYGYLKVGKDLESKIAKGAVVLDVRTAGEFSSGHIAGSINISLGTIRDRYIELDREKTYITTCSHGLRSGKVEKILRELGFKHVYNGGAWVDLEKIVKQQKDNR